MEAQEFLDSYLGQRKRDLLPVSNMTGSHALARFQRQQLAFGVAEMIKQGRRPTHYAVLRLPYGYTWTAFIQLIENYLDPPFQAEGQRLTYVVSFDMNYVSADKAYRNGKKVTNPAGHHLDVLFYLSPEVEKRFNEA